MRIITEKDIVIDNNWIHVQGVGAIGMYMPDEKVIGLDYSMKWIVGTSERIPCTGCKWGVYTELSKYSLENEIKQIIVQLFNASLSDNPSKDNHSSGEQK